MSRERAQRTAEQILTGTELAWTILLLSGNFFMLEIREALLQKLCAWIQK